MIITKWVIEAVYDEFDRRNEMDEVAPYTSDWKERLQGVYAALEAISGADWHEVVQLVIAEEEKRY